MNIYFKYSIITPAFNEAAFIEKTIQNVLCQTILPQKWIIVDDGSTDQTADIIKKYAAKHPLIQYVYREKPAGQAYFASNVHAIMKGWQALQGESFDYLAILDADISLPKDYYERIQQCFASDEKLGVASGIYENLIDGKLYRVLHDRRSTPKAIQVFRREVFEQMGGFLPLKYGGEDTIACVMARMAGWKAWSFPDIKVIHHRPTGTERRSSALRVRFKQGICEYSLATHPVFFMVKSIRRALLEKPYVIGGVARLWGYVIAFLRREEILLPPDIVRFVRREQFNRITHLNKVDPPPSRSPGAP